MWWWFLRSVFSLQFLFLFMICVWISVIGQLLLDTDQWPCDYVNNFTLFLTTKSKTKKNCRVNNSQVNRRSSLVNLLSLNCSSLRYPHYNNKFTPNESLQRLWLCIFIKSYIQNLHSQNGCFTIKTNSIQTAFSNKSSTKSWQNWVKKISIISTQLWTTTTK